MNLKTLLTCALLTTTLHPAFAMRSEEERIKDREKKEKKIQKIAKKKNFNRSIRSIFDQSEEHRKKFAPKFTPDDWKILCSQVNDWEITLDFTRQNYTGFVKLVHDTLVEIQKVPRESARLLTDFKGAVAILRSCYMRHSAHILEKLDLEFSEIGNFDSVKERITKLLNSYQENNDLEALSLLSKKIKELCEGDKTLTEEQHDTIANLVPDADCDTANQEWEVRVISKNIAQLTKEIKTTQEEKASIEGILKLPVQELIENELKNLFEISSNIPPDIFSQNAEGIYKNVIEEKIRKALESLTNISATLKKLKDSCEEYKMLQEEILIGLAKDDLNEEEDDGKMTDDELSSYLYKIPGRWSEKLNEAEITKMVDRFLASETLCSKENIHKIINHWFESNDMEKVNDGTINSIKNSSHGEYWLPELLHQWSKSEQKLLSSACIMEFITFKVQNQEPYERKFLKKIGAYNADKLNDDILNLLTDEILEVVLDYYTHNLDRDKPKASSAFRRAVKDRNLVVPALPR